MIMNRMIGFIVATLSLVCLRVDRDAILWADDRDVIQSAKDAPQPLAPEESAAKIRLPDGFRIELVASEPIVREPSCIAFDERGRMFVCELHGYNIEGHVDVTQLNKTGKLDKEVQRIRWELRGGEIADQAARRQFGVVKMLTDTDGDGVMDKAHIWADDLPPCYGIVAAGGGIIVTCAPDIVFLADRDGDGEADARQTLFTGFNKRVMERGINNPRWGLDNWIYVGGGGEGGMITGPHLDKPFELRNSDFRIQADGSAIEPINGRVGTFGMTINDVGDRFPASGGQPAIYALPLPYRYLSRNPWVATPETNQSAVDYNRGYRISQPHPWRVRRGQDPAWVKFYGARETNSNYFSGGCSNECYCDTLFPEQFHGNVFYCEPSLNIVHRCVIERDAAGYRGHRAQSEQQSEFLASTDQWFRPMNLRVGPDGALYIVDMYREIIEDYSAIPRFLQQQYGIDKGGDHGRIWRLLPESASDEAGARRASADLSKLSAAELLDAIESPSLWKRLTAQRLLVQRSPASAAQSLSAKVRLQADPHVCTCALYTLDGLGVAMVSDITLALDHEHYGVRMHALRLSDRWLDSDAQLLDRVIAMADDDDPSVRLQLAMTLGESGNPAVADALCKLASQYGSERWMDAAILSSSSGRADALLSGLLQPTKLTTNSRPLLRPLAATLAGERDAAAMSRLLTTIAGLDHAIQTACLNGLVDGVSRGSDPVPESADGFAGISRLLTSESKAVRDLATKLSSTVPVADNEQLKSIFANASMQAKNETLAVEKRRQAIEILSSAPFDVVVPIAMAMLDSRQPPSLQLAAVNSLGELFDKRVGPMILQKWSSYTPSLREAVMKSFFARADRIPALLDAIETTVISPGDITAMQREQLVASSDKSVATRAKKLLAVPATDADLHSRTDRYGAALTQPRDIAHGKRIFLKHCLACHKLHDEGYDIGPPLGSIVSHPDETILLDLLDPSGRIEPEYRGYIVITEDGRSFSGVLAAESATSVTLRKEKGVSETILRANIDVMKASSVSLMPSNLHEQVDPQGASDLIGFMRQEFSATLPNKE